MTVTLIAEMGKMKKIVLACMAIGAAKMSFTVEVANASAKTVFVMEKPIALPTEEMREIAFV